MATTEVVDNAGAGMGAFPPVTVYTSYDCHWCGKAKQYLAQRGVPYTEKNVEDDPAAAQEALTLTGGHRGVPVIAVGAQVIEGFRRGELDAALGLAAPEPTTEAALPIDLDTQVALVAAGRIAWTPAQEATAVVFTQMVDAEALCGYVAQQLDHSLANCDHTFRHVGAFLAAHPVAEHPGDTPLSMLGTLGIHCDCGYAINICAR